jgi:thioredoxin 1
MRKIIDFNLHIISIFMSYTEVSDSEEFKNIIEEYEYTIIDFYAEWCGPCKKFAPVFEKYASKYHVPSKLNFVKVEADSEELYSISKSYNIKALPTFILINKTGEAIKEIKGVDENEFINLIKEANRLNQN